MQVRYVFFFTLLISVELCSKCPDQVCSLFVSDSLRAGRLTVGGTTTLNNLTVLGSEVVNGNLSIMGQLFLNGCQVTCPPTPICPPGCQITTPASTTDNAIVLFSGTTGRILKQSPAPVTIDPGNNINQVNSITMSGNLNMVDTTDDFTQGVITKNGLPFIHNAGGSSTFVGVSAGASGGFFENTGIGSQALQSLTIGRDNTATGFQAMRDNSAGSFNVAFGTFSLILNQTGRFNTALGYLSLAGNVAGQGNVAVGTTALENCTANNNVAVGFGAGLTLTTGTNDIYIGTNVGNPPLDPTESFTTRIGIQGLQTACFIAGIRDVMTGLSNTVPVLIDGNGQLGTISSSRRYKQDITDMGDLSANILKLRPVTFKYKPEIEKYGALQYGLIAEEVEEICPDLVVSNKDGQPETVKYHLLVIPLLNELKKYIKRQQELDEALQELMERVSNLESR